MGRYFVNTNSAKDTPTAKGWGKANQYDGKRTAHIPDTINGGLALDKMGTSIPHPFARLFVFRTAFEQVTATGIDQKNTSYAKLTSECLDLLEFLYQYGDQIEIHVWDSAERDKLAKSDSPGHRRMAETFGKALKNLSFKNNADQSYPVDTIFLFFFKGALLGGTSPYTLVFTSPNIRRNLEKVRVSGAKGLAGNELFPDYALASTMATPLSARHKKFQEFLTRYNLAYQTVMGSTVLGDYVNKVSTIHGNETLSKWANAQETERRKSFEEDFASLAVKVDGAAKAVNVLEGAVDGMFMPLCYKPSGVEALGGQAGDASIVSDDYQLRPTRKDVKGQLPLVISPAGLPGAKYIGGKELGDNGKNPSTSAPIAERILPGGHNLAYPYVYSDDFIENTLVQLPFKVDVEHFLTAECEGKHFLLPIKRDYFHYFTPVDLKKDLRIEREGESYLVKLAIPVKFNGKKVEVTKYINIQQNVLNLDDGDHLLGTAIFPTYRVTNHPELNQYKVMLCDEGCEAKFRFYNHEGKQLESKEKSRNTPSPVTYYDVPGAFDFIQVELEDGKARGLIVPMFFDIESQPRDNVKFGVDFGTTNTYICIKDGDSLTQDFEIKSSRPQVFTLNKVNLEKGNGSTDYKNSMEQRGIDTFYYAFLREFVPHVLGGENSLSAFPIRSVVCEKTDFVEDKNNAKELTDISIGFNYQNEAISAPKYKYTSNIKWLLNRQETSEVKKVEAYINELTWLIKNAALLLDEPTHTPKLYVTFPNAMRRGDLRKFEALWKHALQEKLSLEDVDSILNTEVREALAPYLYISKQAGTVAVNTLNVDIGGGTTDILYIDHDKKVMFCDSTKFAANDLWGDGSGEENKFKNGFYLKVDKAVTSGNVQLEPDVKERYEQQKAMAKNSSDVLNYVFTEEKSFTTDMLFSDVSLRRVLATHFALLLYHIGQTFKAKGMEISKNLQVRFSGLGSKYIKFFLKSNADIAEFMKKFFEEMELKVGRIEVKSDGVKSPKIVTAQGATEIDNPQIAHQLEAYGVSGKVDEVTLNFGQEEILTYEAISKRKEDVFKEVRNFVKVLTEGKFAKYLRDEYDIKFTQEFKNALVNETDMSVGFANNAKVNDMTETVDETSFFWPVKETLVKTSLVTK